MSQGAHETVVPVWTFADRLRKVRRDIVGVEQAEMAARLGLPKGAYQSWETGKARPREIVAVARRVELLTGVPASWTLGLDDVAQSAGSTTTMIRSEDAGAAPNGSRASRSKRGCSGSPAQQGWRRGWRGRPFARAAGRSAA